MRVQRNIIKRRQTFRQTNRQIHALLTDTARDGWGRGGLRERRGRETQRERQTETETARDTQRDI